MSEGAATTDGVDCVGRAREGVDMRALRPALALICAMAGSGLAQPTPGVGVPAPSGAATESAPLAGAPVADPPVPTTQVPSPREPGRAGPEGGAAGYNAGKAGPRAGEAGFPQPNPEPGSPLPRAR